MPVARVKNLNRALDELKAAGLWIVGADMDGEDVYSADLTGPVALLIGSEGDGVSRMARQRCDRVVSLPIRGHIDSLNASVAAGVLMYEILRQREIREI
jgi:23S rRNA (guanosine2251-2'-O)-methyltransferase